MLDKQAAGVKYTIWHAKITAAEKIATKVC